MPHLVATFQKTCYTINIVSRCRYEAKNITISEENKEENLEETEKEPLKTQENEEQKEIEEAYSEQDKSELDTIEAMLEDCAPADGYDETAINDFFWFEDDTIAEWLGYEDFESLMNERDAAQA